MLQKNTKHYQATKHQNKKLKSTYTYNDNEQSF